MNSGALNPNTIPLVVLLLGSVVFFVALGILPITQFPEETIAISVHPHKVKVLAVYTYRNPWPIPITQGFGLPFPIDDQHPAPLPIELKIHKTEQRILISRFFDDETFTLNFAPHETIAVSLYYEQEAHTPNARYILTTTKSWGLPLTKARYLLKTEGVSKIHSNYKMRQDDENNWHWERRDFMPESDWLIEWENNS